MTDRLTHAAAAAWHGIAENAVFPLKDRLDAALKALSYYEPAVVKAWEQGYNSGHSRAMRRMSDEPDVEPGKNPYLEAKDD